MNCLYRPRGRTCRRRSAPGSPYCTRCAKLSRRSKLGRAMKKLCAGEIDAVSLVPAGPTRKRVVISEKSR